MEKHSHAAQGAHREEFWMTFTAKSRRIIILAALAAAFLGGHWLWAQLPRAPEPKHYAWSDASLSPDERADMLLKEMTLDEKISLLHGQGMPFGSTGPTESNGGAGYINSIPHLGIPAIQMADSAYGVARGATAGRYSTALPNNLAAASAWDPQAAFEYGALIGRELRNQGYSMTLGGGINLPREPRNGRTFEYMGEDPLLAGILDGNVVKGMQSQFVIGDLKHYALNDQESGRNAVNVNIDKRSMRVLSDWGGTHSTAKASHNGLDMEQPGKIFFGDELKKAVESGGISQDELDEHVHRVLRTIFASGLFDHPVAKQVPDIDKGAELAQRLAEKSIVLLKNEHSVLPLESGIRTVAVIGGHADAGVISGGGSAQVDAPGGSAVPPPSPSGNNPTSRFMRQQWLPSSPLKALTVALLACKVTFNSGDDAAAAAAAAKQADVAIVFAWQWESEGFDLPTLHLASEQNALIEAVAAANPKTVVVLETGSPATMPWIDKVAAVVEAWYPGIRGAEALANILTGKVNPSGKLAITFPRSDDDLPHPKLVLPPPESQMNFGGGGGDISARMARAAKGLPPFQISYDEGLKVGYKWYDAEKKAVLFPFGFGLSYTTFAYSGLSVKAGDGLSVSFTVKNTGKRAGTEIAQVYTAFPDAAGEPPKRLIGWTRVDLAPGEQETVTVAIDHDRLTVYDEASDSWKLVPGNYNVQVGGSSQDLPLHQKASM